MNPRHPEFLVYADHNQFYLCDQGPWEGEDHLAPEDDMLWVGAAAENRLDVRPGTIAVLTKTYGYVRVHLDVCEVQPEDDPGRHDHVVEASLESRSGTLVLIEETAEVGKLRISPGIYRARLLGRARTCRREQSRREEPTRELVDPAVAGAPDPDPGAQVVLGVEAEASRETP